MTLVLVKQERRGAFSYSEWADGTCQYEAETVLDPLEADTGYFLERVKKPRSRMPKWCVVERGPEDHDNCYPPIVAGPFDTLPQAKKMYLVFLALKGISQGEGEP